MSVATILTALASSLQSVLDAVNLKLAEKGQTSAQTLNDVPTKIQAIPEGTDTSDANAVSGDILSGKTAYVNGVKLTGDIASKNSSDMTVSGSTVFVPSGYYSSNASKSIPTIAQATPHISLSSSSGIVSASSTQSAGYVLANTKHATMQLNIKPAQTYTPDTGNKTIFSGRYLTGDQTILGDANLVAENIKSGVSIFDVAGNYDNASKICCGSLEPSNSDYSSSEISLPLNNSGISDPKLVVIIQKTDYNNSVSFSSDISLSDVFVLAFNPVTSTVDATCLYKTFAQAGAMAYEITSKSCYVDGSNLCVSAAVSGNTSPFSFSTGISHNYIIVGN